MIIYWKLNKNQKCFRHFSNWILPLKLIDFVWDGLGDRDRCRRLVVPYRPFMLRFDSPSCCDRDGESDDVDQEPLKKVHPVYFIDSFMVLEALTSISSMHIVTITMSSMSAFLYKINKIGNSVGKIGILWQKTLSMRWSPLSVYIGNLQPLFFQYFLWKPSSDIR